MLEQPSLGSEVEPSLFIFLLTELEVAGPISQQDPADLGTEVEERELQVGLAGRAEEGEVWLEGEQPGEQSLLSLDYGEVEASQPGTVGQVQVGLKTVAWQQQANLVAPRALALTHRVENIISCSNHF